MNNNNIAAIVSRGPNMQIRILRPLPWLDDKNPWTLHLEMVRPNGIHGYIRCYQAATFDEAVALASKVLKELIPSDATIEVEEFNDDK